jgi:hypothetical protein
MDRTVNKMSKDIQTSKEDEKKSQTPPETETPPEGSPAKEEVDYKQKFADSTRENQRIVADSQEKDQRIGALETKLVKANETLSDKELKSEYPDFEDMLPEEQQRAKSEFKNKKDIAILKAKDKMREDYFALPQETREKIDKKGGFEPFKNFACNPENAGQKNLLNLAKQFLYEEETPTPVEQPAPGLEEGTGGQPSTPPREEGFTAEELGTMRKNESKKYMELAKEGKLKFRK